MKRSRTTLLVLLTLILTLGAAAPAPAADLDPATRDALAAALDDERQAQATYRAAAETYAAGPFAHIVDAEGRHEAHLLDLYAAHGLEPPADRWAEAEIVLPDTVQAACAEAAAWETENAALYDELLESVEAADVRQVFELLRSRSRDRHLPAFQRCAEGSAGGGMGMGPGHGAGPGQGRGACRMGGGGGQGGGAMQGQGAMRGKGGMHGRGAGPGKGAKQGGEGAGCCAGCKGGATPGEGCTCRRRGAPAGDV